MSFTFGLLIQERRRPAESASTPSRLRPFPCRINARVFKDLDWTADKVRVVKCLLEDDEHGRKDVFVPFSFVQKYFDVSSSHGERRRRCMHDIRFQIYGEMQSNANGSWFQWSHSYSRVFPSFGERKYAPEGAYLQFDDFVVETRSRVKCVSAANGVPISTQWNKEGYFYSTQIAQFALSHWSKHVRRKNRTTGNDSGNRVVYEDGGRRLGDWRGDTTRVLSLNSCVHFDRASPVALDFDAGDKRAVLSFDLQFKQAVNVSVLLRSTRPGANAYVVRYVPRDLDVRREDNVVVLGYGAGLREGQWKRFTRSVMYDLKAGVGKKVFLEFRDFGRVAGIQLDGVGCVTNVSLSRQEHLAFFSAGADWLAANQDARGGWPVDVVFNKDHGKYARADEVAPGWYSAMAQGHALSVLTRAHRHAAAAPADRARYLAAGLRALPLFRAPSEDGGFVAHFMDDPDLVWYEEYPTAPATFVLNGFMYCLLGLYDLQAALVESGGDHAGQLADARALFAAGMRSLRTLLPLFDAGSTSAYDLRHFTMHVAPKLARWDYHAAHINLLYVLSTLDDGDGADAVLADTAERWRGYMLGKTAGHN